MTTLTISTSDSRTLTVTAKELSEIIKIDGLDKIEVLDGNGWDYLENKMVDAGFFWDAEATVTENIERFVAAYEVYLQNPTREEEFGNAVNAAE